MTKLHRGYTQEDVEKLAAIVREADNWLNIEDECMELAKAAGLEDEWSAADGENIEDIMDKIADALGVAIYERDVAKPTVKRTLCWVETQKVYGPKSHRSYGDCFQDSFSWDWDETLSTAKHVPEWSSPYDRERQIVSAQRVEIEVDVGATPEEAHNDWALACMGDADYVEFIDSAH